MASEPNHRDELQEPKDPPRAPASEAPRTSLPIEDPNANTVPQQRADLRAKLDELEGMFRFMGRGHPRFERTRQQIRDYQMMLERLDALT